MMVPFTKCIIFLAIQLLPSIELSTSAMSIHSPIIEAAMYIIAIVMIVPANLRPSHGLNSDA